MKVDHRGQSVLPASLDLPGLLEREVNEDRAGYLEKLDLEDQLDLLELEVGTTLCTSNKDRKLYAQVKSFQMY